jgi:predicted GNAT family acetyltransferase
VATLPHPCDLVYAPFAMTIASHTAGRPVRLVDEPSAAELLTRGSALFSGEREVEANLPLGLLDALCRGRYAQCVPWLWSLRDGARLVGLAVRTPPFPLVVSPMPDEACAAVAEALAARALLPLELNGPRPVVERIVEGLRASGELTVQVVTNMRLFVLSQVTPAPPTTGVMRRASAEHEAELLSMMRAFIAEAIPHEADRHDAAAQVARLVATGAAFVWEDHGEAVAFAAFGRRVGEGASIGPVFTPQHLRGRGYATGLVAALSEQLLREGCRYTCLFTNLANPISNSIYPKVGYRPVYDMRHVALRYA